MPSARSAQVDLRIQEALLAELNWGPRFAPAEIGVEVDEGIVTLRGTVSSYQKLRAAAEIAARMPDVKAVVNDLWVQVGADNDLDLARRARLALELDADIPADALQCLVHQGTLTLRGSVDHGYQRAAAEHVASRLDGLRELVLEIDVRGHRRNDGEIRADLKAALLRRIPWASLVTFRVDDGVVTLSGRVHSLSDRATVEETAWSTRGVNHVIDRLAVTAKSAPASS